MSRSLAPIAVWLCVMCMPVFAGKSLVLTPGVRGQVNDPNLASNRAWRVEFQLHDWGPPTVDTIDGFVWDLNGIGASAAILNGGVLRITDKRDAIPGGAPCQLYLPASKNVLVRVQRDPAQMRFACEMWNVDGSGYQQKSLAISSFLDWGFSGGVLGSSYTTASLGFFRIFTTLVPDGGRPPVTADPGDWTELKFDGSLSDTSGHGHSASLAGATYMNTPDQNPVAYIKTDGAPSWSDWVSMRAGYPATLDGTRSFSMADQSATVSYSWQQVGNRPTKLFWSSQSAAKPVIRGLVFGTYHFRLQVTDAMGKTAAQEMEIGAVAMDDNGVVVQANPDADKIFGPMIAFGKNPWPWADDMALHSATVRRTYINSISPPGWGINLAGTISYSPARAGQAAQTSLASPMTASDMTMTVADASRLDLSSFPTVLIVHTPNVWSPLEEMRICSADGNVLTVCYDGRSWRGGTYERFGGPQNWNPGATVRQVKTTGSGTAFLTDFCPAGPGEPGRIVTSAGTVSVTPGSANLRGSGTNWDGTLQGMRVRIQGTHAGGTPFVFFASVAAVSSGTSLSLGRPWPADADPGAGLSYSILNSTKSIARSWNRPDGTVGRQTTTLSSCESDTQLYHADIFSNVAGDQTAQTYGYSEGTWFSDFGPNYYDEVLAEYAGYYRSGYGMFLKNAEAIGDYWAKSPDFDEGWLGTIPRRASVTGMVAAAVLDGRVSNWYTLRNLAGAAISNPYTGAIQPGCDADVRETAYNLSWLAFAAMFDPKDTGDPNEPGQRSYWRAQLANAYARDNRCRGPNSEFPTPYWGGTGSYTLTNGSDTVKGNGIPASLCPVTATGTISVVNGSTAATGSNFKADAKIVIVGMRQGQPYLFYSQFGFNSPTSITMASPYDGDSGTYAYQIESDINWMAFATGTTDHQLMNTLYACKWVDSSTITLDRPWAGASGTYQAYRYQELGYGTQPFFAGIKALAMNWAAMGATGETASNYAALANSTANWVLTTGFDPLTGGLHYARGWGGCEPNETPRMNCTYSTSAAGRQVARFLNAEAQNAMRIAYQANPTAQNKLLGDEFYGAQWGKLGGPWHDDVYLSELEQDSMWNYKWLGFLFGIGMAHQWPAVRLGGVQQPVPVYTQIPVDFSAHARAVRARITVTQSSGHQLAPFECSSDVCGVTSDKRQGDFWYRIEYLDSVGKPVSPPTVDLLKLS